MFNNNEENKPIRVAFYARVSTDEQVRDGYGIKMQIDNLNDVLAYNQKNNCWTHKKEWEYIDDGYSGADLNRPHFKRMMDAVRNKEFDLIVVWKIDRLSRNLSHLLKVFEDIKKCEVSLYSSKENIDFTGPIGRLTFQIFGALAEFERETIKMRTMDGKMASARSGNYVGGAVSYGYKRMKNKSGKGNRLEIIEKEAEWIRKIYKWFVYEGKNYNQIAKELNDFKVPKGLESRNKDKNTIWRDKMVARILTDKAYTGLDSAKFKDENTGKDIVIEQKIPKIISDIDFRQSQYIVERVTDNRGGGDKEYLLSRKIKNVETGQTLTGYSRTKGGFGYRCKRYDNKNGTFIPGYEIPAKSIEDFVWAWCKVAINRPEDLKKAFELQNSDDKLLKTLLGEEEFFNKKIEENTVSIENVWKTSFNGDITDQKRDKFLNDYQNAIASLEGKKRELKIKINELLDVKIAKDAIDNLPDNLSEKIKKEDFELKKRMINVLVHNVEMIKNKDGNMGVKLNFKFALQKVIKPIDSIEPNNIINTIKKEESNNASFSNGGQ